MSETRRATVMLIQHGDPEIAGALVAGVMAGRAEASAHATEPHLQEADAQPVDSVEIVTVEQDKWRRVARQVHVAIGNTKTAEDYHLMIIKARSEYAIHPRTGRLHTAAEKLLMAWVLLCEAMRKAYRAQNRVLKP